MSDAIITKVQQRDLAMLDTALRLLSEALNDRHRAEWQASYLKLAVYNSSPDAQHFYERLGFVGQINETTMILGEKGLTALKGKL